LEQETFVNSGAQHQISDRGTVDEPDFRSFAGNYLTESLTGFLAPTIQMMQIGNNHHYLAIYLNR
jgi:hypothetical protein